MNQHSQSPNLSHFFSMWQKYSCWLARCLMASWCLGFRCASAVGTLVLQNSTHWPSMQAAVLCAFRALPRGWKGCFCALYPEFSALYPEFSASCLCNNNGMSGWGKEHMLMSDGWDFPPPLLCVCSCGVCVVHAIKTLQICCLIVCIVFCFLELFIFGHFAFVLDHKSSRTCCDNMFLYVYVRHMV